MWYVGGMWVIPWGKSGGKSVTFHSSHFGSFCSFTDSFPDLIRFSPIIRKFIFFNAEDISVIFTNIKIFHTEVGSSQNFGNLFTLNKILSALSNKLEHVEEYPAMHGFVIPRHTLSMSFNLLTEGVVKFWSNIVLKIPYSDGLAIILSPQFYV